MHLHDPWGCRRPDCGSDPSPTLSGSEGGSPFWGLLPVLGGRSRFEGLHPLGAVPPSEGPLPILGGAPHSRGPSPFWGPLSTLGAAPREGWRAVQVCTRVGYKEADGPPEANSAPVLAPENARPHRSAPTLSGPAATWEEISQDGSRRPRLRPRVPPRGLSRGPFGSGCVAAELRGAGTTLKPGALCACVSPACLAGRKAGPPE